MEKIRLDLDALGAEPLVMDAGAPDGHGTVAAHEAGQTRNCATPLCTAGTSCI